YSSVRLDLRQIEQLKSAGEVVGSRVRARVKKNKVAPPFKAAEFDIMYDRGISREGDVLDLGVNYGVITKRGSFYSYGEQRLAQGREDAKEFLSENPHVAFEIESRIREMAGLPDNRQFVGSE
ncbi:MAG: DNA recombination/repair protein RecA, partial [Anaerolineae bacterium]